MMKQKAIEELLIEASAKKAIMDAAKAEYDSARALLLEEMERANVKALEYNGVKAIYYSENNGFAFDEKAFCSDETRRALYEQYKTKPTHKNAYVTVK